MHTPRGSSGTPNNTIVNGFLARCKFNYDRPRTRAAAAPRQSGFAQLSTSSKPDWVANIKNMVADLCVLPTGAAVVQYLTLHSHKAIEFSNVDTDGTEPGGWITNTYAFQQQKRCTAIVIPSATFFPCVESRHGRYAEVFEWLMLGHELIHLIHALNGTWSPNFETEERNTVSGDAFKKPTNRAGASTFVGMLAGLLRPDQYYYRPPQSLGLTSMLPHHKIVARLGRSSQPLLYTITENQLRAEARLPPRKGYGSVAVCDKSNTGGCDKVFAAPRSYCALR